MSVRALFTGLGVFSISFGRIVVWGFIEAKSMASKYIPKDVAGKAKSFLSKLLKPWEITGPTATPEFLESVPLAKDYRKIAPATMPVRPAIPHAEPATVFDIKYHTRDRKRHLVQTVQEVEPSALAAELTGLPPTPGKLWNMGKECHMDDEPGGGYQK